MRWTYANAKALKVLKASQGNNRDVIYPDGSIFAKVGVATIEDAKFPSSKVPGGARRVQFMVRDAKKYADTGGWGYALFDANGKTFPGEPKAASLACAACHAIVADQGGVFSRLMDPLAVHPAVSKPAVASDAVSAIVFENVNADTLPQWLKSQLPKKTVRVRSYRGPLTENNFQGTLDEIKPALLKESSALGLPALFKSSEGERFALVYRAPANDGCNEATEQSYISVHSMPLPQKPMTTTVCLANRAAP
jgi:hypothetical protein